MLVINWQNFIENKLQVKTSMTTGIFDGIHRGHQALIKRIVLYNKDYIPAVITFRQNHKTKQKDIITFEHKLKMFEELGIKITIIIDFTEEFKQMPGIEFLRLIKNHGNLGFFAVGSHFCCGYQLDTNTGDIKDFFDSYGIPVEIIPQVMENSMPISSSRIRTAISTGDHKIAEVMLGHNIYKK